MTVENVRSLRGEERIQVSFTQKRSYLKYFWALNSALDDKETWNMIEHPRKAVSRNNNLLTTGKTHTKRADVIETVLGWRKLFLFIRPTVIYLEQVDTQENEPKVKDRLDQNAEEDRHDVHWFWKALWKKLRENFVFFSNRERKYFLTNADPFKWRNFSGEQRKTILNVSFSLLRENTKTFSNGAACVGAHNRQQWASS
jgi:hypothetical protein